MTDTAAYSDLIFGLFRLLGFQFSPRLANMGGTRFWRIDRRAEYGPLDGLARSRINLRLIRTHWDDILRVAGSLVQGTVSASELIRALQRGGRPSSLARAISEIGRIAKTLHLLTYIDDESYRRRILRQINRGEGRHSVARAVFFGKRGELRQRYKEGQEFPLGPCPLVGLSLKECLVGRDGCPLPPQKATAAGIGICHRRRDYPTRRRRLVLPPQVDGREGVPPGECFSAYASRR